MKIDLEKITTYIAYGVSLGKWFSTVLSTFPKWKERRTKSNQEKFQSERTFEQSGQDLGSDKQVRNG